VAESHPSAERSHISRWLSRIDRHASRPLTAVLVVTAAAVWIAVSIAVGFPARWEIIFQTVVAALTLTMVFVIQHTQARHQRATQRKLDEILLAMPGTDNSLLRLEHASDDELRAAGDQHREIRQLRSSRSPRRPPAGARTARHHRCHPAPAAGSRPPGPAGQEHLCRSGGQRRVPV